MFTKMKSAVLGLLVALVGFGGVASATVTTPSIDTTAVTDYINTEMIPALVAVGGVIIIAAVVAVGYKWLKGMLFS